MPSESPNFGFLARHDPLLVKLASVAEQLCYEYPDTAILKLRQFAEVLARQMAAQVGMEAGEEANFIDVLRELEDQQVLTRELAELFHLIRKAGNQVAHTFQVETKAGEAIHLLKMARELAVWFHRTFGNQPHFKAGSFTPPAEPTPAASLQDQIAELKELLGSEVQGRQLAEITARKATEDRDAALELAQEIEAILAQERSAWEAKLVTLRTQATPEQVETTAQRAQEAAQQLSLNEADTRKIIDARLREAGWEADTEEIAHGKGVRPQRGRNLAIAEWPTSSGPADYVLFVGLIPVAIVEAKRKIKQVPGHIEQAKRYSRDYQFEDYETPPEGVPWGNYKVPFLFATNGRPYLRQLEDQSGIWFLDARRPTNHPRALDGWYSPEGLLHRLKQDEEMAEEELRESSPDYLPLRDYQKEAILAVERGLEEGQRSMLLAMATGTGKTRTCICLVYRLLKARRFHRVLFLVDRNALGEQAANFFKHVRLENLQSFTDIYDVKELGDVKPDPDTRLHIATIQGMVKRLLYSSDDESIFSVDAYDCIVVDECHRGYNLDREMSDAELTFRSERDYISKYRRVLDHFDGIKVGLTATPALHTTEIFGEPIYQYSYRQAVIDGWLVDHAPPIRIKTALAEQGIRWEAGEEVKVYRVHSGQIDLFRTPDEIDVEIDDFNRRVQTESFNRTVCRELVKHIDPTLPGKTLVFCANDWHADQVVRLLKEAFDEQYGGIEDDAVQKITGQVDHPTDKIRHYKNERLPSVAVTVDLLTTGIDVPEIVNLVFIRRVRSRILYEQMLGRATRLCPELHGPSEDKQLFSIFDAVNLYDALEPYTAMKPIVSDPQISFKQLVAELATIQDEDACQEILDQFIAKLQRKRRWIERRLKDEFETAVGVGPKELLDQLKAMDLEVASGFLQAQTGFIELLDRRVPSDSPQILISEHEDELMGVEVGYGASTRPEDYLEEFERFIKEHMNDVPALRVVTQRPRDLTRQQLRELKLALDQAGYSEARLQTAWRNMTNQEIAASIIGFIRQRALGDPLIPYEERVDRAVQTILSSRPWTVPQRRWLERITKQIKQETIVDPDSFDRGAFKQQGGFNRLNRVFDGKLQELLGDIHEEIWRVSA